MFNTKIKTQYTLKLQQEQNKQVRKLKVRAKKEAYEQQMFEIRQQKKKEMRRCIMFYIFLIFVDDELMNY